MPFAGRILPTVLAAALFCASLVLHAEDAPGTPFSAAGMQNTFRLTDRLLSGSQPEGDAAFAALARLGVKTIVSVDGAKPDVAAARKYGLRYIHLPFGYDGVPPERIPELARAASVPGGLIYVHCHHGKHRGPAAAAVMCEATAGWSRERAEAWLREAGTGEDYPGLYRSVREFQPIAPAALARVGALPEVAKTPPLVDLMVALDERMDLLLAARKTSLNSPPARDATLLWEQLRELARTGELDTRPADFRNRLAAAEQAADKLRKAIGPAEFDAAIESASQSCAACHKAWRNERK